MEEPLNLSQDEVKMLKELADNLMAMGRVRRVLTTTLLWLAGIIGAMYLIWDKLVSHVKWNS